MKKAKEGDIVALNTLTGLLATQTPELVRLGVLELLADHLDLAKHKVPMNEKDSTIPYIAFYGIANACALLDDNDFAPHKPQSVRDAASKCRSILMARMKTIVEFIDEAIKKTPSEAMKGFVCAFTVLCYNIKGRSLPEVRIRSFVACILMFTEGHASHVI